MIIDLKQFSHYIVTGVDVYGKRFKQYHKSACMAYNINLFSGSVWGVCVKTGKRKLLKRVCN